VNIYDKLSLIAQDILAAPASQAYLERGFSVCGLLTACSRNRMGATENARPDIAKLDNAAPYRKGGHRETVSVFEYMLTTSLFLIQGVLYELFIGFMFVVLFLSILLIAMCGRLSWPALWTTFGRIIK